MQAIEFKANIENNTIHIPTRYQNLNHSQVRVIILTKPQPQARAGFNPRAFFGVGNLSKAECDSHLSEMRDGWNQWPI